MSLIKTPLMHNEPTMRTHCSVWKTPFGPVIKDNSGEFRLEDSGLWRFWLEIDEDKFEEIVGIAYHLTQRGGNERLISNDIIELREIFLNRGEEEDEE